MRNSTFDTNSEAITAEAAEARHVNDSERWPGSIPPFAATGFFCEAGAKTKPAGYFQGHVDFIIEKSITTGLRR